MPAVSIIVPCFNEETTIQLLLDALYHQTYPRAQMEVVIADARSSDRTREKISAFSAQHADLCIRVVDNPRRIIPAGLNQAIRAATAEFIIRVDAHSMPYPDYVERCIAALEAGLGDNVGGVWEIRPAVDNWVARSIAVAAAHPLGVGDARYRLGGRAQAVDTVPFGAFRRSLIDRIGYYDETLLTNEDYELNTRIRQSGGVVWLDPHIRTRYIARPTLGALAHQYWRYGYWKARMLRRYPQTLRWRQLLPPLFIISLLLLSLLSILYLPLLGLVVVELIVYNLFLIFVGLQVAWKKGDAAFVIGVPLAIATMHVSWGSAFLWSLVKLMFESIKP